LLTYWFVVPAEGGDEEPCGASLSASRCRVWRSTKTKMGNLKQGANNEAHEEYQYCASNEAADSH
jgi:hypothetical protein